ncbi:MAG TPA: cardiolipin synthase B, partial [Paraburkholderia sp.]|nr:cardiolipin synthase B [Paraburkholderia sp.]
NDEANLNIYDAAFARRQTRIFADDLAKSKRVTFEEWNRRPWTTKLVDRVVALLDPQL